MLLQSILLALCACAPPLQPGVDAQRIPDPARRALYRLEKIDLDTMLNNDRIMTSYVRCFVGKGACSPEARDFRKLLPKLTATACGDCTPNQKRIIKRIFQFMYTERSSDWKQLQDMFDPKHKFEKKIHDFMELPKTESEPEVKLESPISEIPS